MLAVRLVVVKGGQLVITKAYVLVEPRVDMLVYAMAEKKVV